MEEDREISNLSRVQDEELEATTAETPRIPKKRFVGRKTNVAKPDVTSDSISPATAETAASQSIQPAPGRRQPRALNRVPAEIQNDPELQAAVALLPPNYDFEVFKTVHRIRLAGAAHIGLQLPEGLLLFATTLADIFSHFGRSPNADGSPGKRPRISILGDVTYGACCVDDFTARALGCDLLVHYAHSCLIPRAGTGSGLSVLYVFVDIGIDTAHLVESVVRNFQSGSTLALFGTVQFNAALHALRSPLEKAGYSIVVPQSAPLSRGEILGCTAPSLASSQSAAPAALAAPSATPQIDSLLYLGDGRFHLEAAMIANPTIPAYRYDPYSRRLTREHYQHADMRAARASAIASARKAQRWGLILGALGRQGNPATLTMIEQVLNQRGAHVVKMVLSEITPTKLALIPDVDVWVQVACPRLSIDWGYAFPRPLLSPYEALVALGVREAAWEVEQTRRARQPDAAIDELGQATYPMDYYAKDGLGRVTVHDAQRGDGLVRAGG